MATRARESIRILHVVNKWQGGGIERYIETLVRAADPDGFEMAVASVRTDIKTNAPCEVYGPLVTGSVGVIAPKRTVGELIERFHPDVVHVHTTNGTGFDYARAAAKAGACMRIVHSHNSTFDAKHRAAKRIYTDLARNGGIHQVTDSWACSKPAGKHLFGKHPFAIMKNGVDTKRFAFDPEARISGRAELGIGADAPVMGFVARFTEAKNPMFALEVFNAFHNQHSNAQMVFMGDGSLADELGKEIKAKGLSGCCHLLGYRNDPERWYSVMDALIAPSLYEGLPINLIEAQSSGLSVLASCSITDEVILRPRVFRMHSLSEGPHAWCDGLGRTICKASKTRASAHKDVMRAGYDYRETVAKVLESYEEAVSKWHG